ncbi:hypothetical protein PAPHI01_1577 [Pancytospora philotis]|nr:hypothetical protein PAPHI01_1577 [Pancytospora philotis]
MHSLIDVAKTRKFHDSWAALLFAVTLVLVNTTIMFSVPNIAESTGQFLTAGGGARNGLILLAAQFALLLVNCVLGFILLIVCPRVLIYAGFIAGFCACLAASVAAGVTGMILAALFAFGMLYFFFVYVHPHIRFISRLIAITALILVLHIVPLCLFLVCIGAVLLLQLAIFGVALNTPGTSALAYVAIVLLSYWIAGVGTYFFQVLASGIVVHTINVRGEHGSVFGRSFSHALYALGSISYGALLVAIVQSLQHCVASARARNSRDESRGILGAVFLAISSVMLAIFSDILATINSMVFTYIAVHGTAYRESVGASFQEIRGQEGKPLHMLYGVDCALNIVGILFGSSFFLLSLCLTGTADQSALLFGQLLALCFVLVFGSIISSISSGVLALAYAKIEFSEALGGYDRQISEALSVLKRPTGNGKVHAAAEPTS